MGFIHFTEKETKAQKGLNNFLKITRLKVSNWDLKFRFLCFYCFLHSYCLWNDTSVLGLSCLQAFPLTGLLSSVFHKLGYAYRSPTVLCKCRFWLRDPGLGPKNLHLSHVPRWQWYSWTKDHTLLSEGPDSRRLTLSPARLFAKWLYALFPFL